MRAIPAFVVLCTALSAGCNNLERTAERTALLSSNGPQIESAAIDAFQKAIENLRRFAPTVATTSPGGRQPAYFSDDLDVRQAALIETREMAFAYVEGQCLAYVDAIFWANRQRGTGVAMLGATGAATSTILAAASAATTAIAITAASFGLATTLFDSYYETFLYNLEPSGVLQTVEEAQKAYVDALTAPSSEGVLLRQVQGYIVQCTPAKIESLVNEKVKAGTVTSSGPEKLTSEEAAKMQALIANTSTNEAERLELFGLVDRWIKTGGDVAPTADAADDETRTEGSAAPTQALTTNSLPVTRGGM